MRILIAGVGNVFLGDDGFGVVVAQKLQARAWPAGVQIVDFGIRGLDLAYALEGYDAAIILDTVARGGSPGTLYLLDPELPAAGASPEMHAMTPDRVLGWIDREQAPQTLRVLGCEPATFEADDLAGAGLSDPVGAAVDEAVLRVEWLVAELLGKQVQHA